MKKGGLHRPPSSFLQTLCKCIAGFLNSHVRAARSRLHFPSSSRPTTKNFGTRKSERPVGAPAARAWGMEGSCNPKRLGPAGAACHARARQNSTQEIAFSSDGPNHFRLRSGVCALGDFPSIGRGVHSSWYFFSYLACTLRRYISTFLIRGRT